MKNFLKDFYAENKPRTLCVLQALPGFSDENILPTMAMMNSPQHSLKFIKEYHQKTCSLNSDVPNWELVETEIYKEDNSLYEAIIVAYYKPIESV
ncbi:hypothetical protein LC593_04900 [Nostoc sp. CHAB 5844]|nr:hypothetical protein [Nostoc sp. CHAB 5844]